MILVSIIVLGILIFVHELGHFAVAKACGVGVVEFSIGFGKKILRKKVGETQYSVGVIPLGGYVKMFGDDPELVYGSPKLSDDDDTPAKNELKSEVQDAEPEVLQDPKRWFLKKPIFPRVLIVLAGPGFNLIFAVLLAIFSFSVYGRVKQLETPVIGAVFPDYPANKAGLVEGDKILSIDGSNITEWQQLSDIIKTSQGREMKFVIERDQDKAGVPKTIDLLVTGTADTSEMDLLNDRPEIKEETELSYKIGILPDVKREPVGFGDACIYGLNHVWYISKLTIRLLVKIVQGAVAPAKVVGGPIAVFAGAAESAKRGIESLMDFMVLLSVSLAIFNLLPIPILDGGHLLFFIIEGLKGSPVNLRWQMIANQFGMVLLLALMIFAISNDLMRYL